MPKENKNFLENELVPKLKFWDSLKCFVKIMVYGHFMANVCMIVLLGHATATDDFLCILQNRN
jgi:hypothetical protein